MAVVVEVAAGNVIITLMDFKYSDNYVQHPKEHSLPEKNTNINHRDHSSMTPAENSAKEYYKLAGILALIAICASIMSTVVGFDWQEWMRWFMGGFFIFFGSFKLIGYEMFTLMFPIYDPLAKKNKLYTLTYPFIEVFLGFLYCVNLAALPRDVVTLFIMSIGAYGVIKSLPRGETIRCACLGNIIKLPLSTVTLLEDLTMAFMAFIMLISHFIL